MKRCCDIWLPFTRTRQNSFATYSPKGENIRSLREDGPGRVDAALADVVGYGDRSTPGPDDWRSEFSLGANSEKTQLPALEDRGKN